MSTNLLKCIDCGELFHPLADVYDPIDDHTCICAGCIFNRFEITKAELEKAKEVCNKYKLEILEYEKHIAELLNRLSVSDAHAEILEKELDDELGYLRIAQEGLGGSIYIVTADHQDASMGVKWYVANIGVGKDCLAQSTQEAMQIAVRLVKNHKEVGLIETRAEKAEADLADALAVIGRVREEVRLGLVVSKGELAVENLAGNIVKAEFWKGEASACRQVEIALLTAPATGKPTTGPLPPTILADAQMEKAREKITSDLRRHGLVKPATATEGGESK